jgi:hypothetical protein
MRVAVGGLDPRTARGILGTNALTVYGLDGARLQAVADRIGPPLADVLIPIDARPAGARAASSAFAHLPA